MYGEGHDLLIAAIGKIPDDIHFFWMTELAVETAKFRVVPFEFNNDGTVKCIHPDWFERFDAILGGD